jgi:hypothetical protein
MPASNREQRRVAARRAKVLELRAAGETFEAIAAECGHKTAAAAAQDFTRALSGRKEILDSQVGLFLTLEQERLDGLERVVRTSLKEAGEAGEHLLVLRCTDRLLRISEHRSNLLRLTRAAPLGRPATDEPLPEAAGDVVANLAGYRSRRRTRAAKRGAR